MHDQQVNFVAIRNYFVGLPQLPLQKRTQALFASIERRRRELTNLVGADFLVDGRKKIQHCVKNFTRGPDRRLFARRIAADARD